jgi:ferritin-like metal-binding protein YciE
VAKSETPARDAVLVKYLNEAYGKEKQLETALQAQIGLAKRPPLVKGLKDHLKVTKAQSTGLAKRIRELGGKADAGPDLGPATGVATAASNLANRAVAATKGPVQALRGTSEADNELRNVRDCLWNEAEEIAHYNVIEAAATELGDTDTAKLARQYRKEEEKMQTLLNRQIPQLIKAVIKEEVPAAERRSNGGRRRASSRSSSSRSSSTSRSSSSRSSSASATSSSSSNGTSTAKRSAAGKKAAATRARKSTTASARSTATTARTTAKKAGTTAKKAGSAARKTASSRGTGAKKS